MSSVSLEGGRDCCIQPSKMIISACIPDLFKSEVILASGFPRKTPVLFSIAFTAIQDRTVLLNNTLIIFLFGETEDGEVC